MNLKDIGAGALQIFKSLAPTLATAAAGPFAPLVAPIINKVFGVDAANPKAVETALLNATPEQVLALRQENDNFQVRMKELGIQEEQLVFTDLADARKMQSAVKDPTVARLAWLNIGGFLSISIGLILAFVFLPEKVAAIPNTAWAMIGSLLGYLGKSSSQSETFYFGSSAGSQAKDATLADLAKS